MEGFDRAIVVDSIVSEGGRPGAIRWLAAPEWLESRNSSSTHDASLAVALEFGRLAGLRLPDEITALAIEAGDVVTLGEELTSEVGQAVPAAVSMVLEELDAAGGAGGETA
jgi:hydrogenase maturation protease